MQNQGLAFAARNSSEKNPNRRHGSARLVSLFALTLVAVASLVTASFATGNVNKADLTGPWVVSLTGNTGCGLVAMEATFNLNSSGTGTATITTHGQCGDSVTTGQTFTVNSLGANGHGSAGLTCGIGCGWTFDIQVAPDRSTFSLVDVTSANVNNFLSGVAVHQ